MSFQLVSLMNRVRITRCLKTAAWGSGCAALAFALAVGVAVPFGPVAFADQDGDEAIDPMLLEEEEAPDTGLSLEELERIARSVNATEIVILSPISEEIGDQWVLFDGVGGGVDRSRGQFVHHVINFDLPDGLWLFPDGGTLFHQEGFDDAGSFVELKESTLLVSGSSNIRRDIIADFSTNNGGVTCGAGYYACCGKDIHGQWRARCIAIGTQPGGGDGPTSCINGGTGSTGCTNGTAIAIVVPVRDIENPAMLEQVNP